MSQIVRFRLDDAACAELTALRARALAAVTDVPAVRGSRGRRTQAAQPDRPAVIAAAATAVPPPARAALAAELRLLTLPSLWLATLGTAAGRPDELVLAAVVDTELLAVHTAVHDALAGRVRGPVADYLPGSWLPHCVLATRSPVAAFAALHPLAAVRARVVGVEIHDTTTGVTDPIA